MKCGFLIRRCLHQSATICLPRRISPPEFSNAFLFPWDDPPMPDFDPLQKNSKLKKNLVKAETYDRDIQSVSPKLGEDLHTTTTRKSEYGSNSDQRSAFRSTREYYADHKREMDRFADDALERERALQTELERDRNFGGVFPAPNIKDIAASAEETDRRRKRNRGYAYNHWLYFKDNNEDNLLTWQAIEQIRELHAADPDKWSAEKVAESFPVSVFRARRLIRSQPRAFTDPLKVRDHDTKVRQRWKALYNGDPDAILTDYTKRLVASGQIKFIPMVIHGDHNVIYKESPRVASVQGPFEKMVKKHLAANGKSLVKVSSQERNNVIKSGVLSASAIFRNK